MKKYKVFIAAALSAVLALGTMPAFAATDTSGNADDASDNIPGSFQYGEGSASGTAEAETSLNVYYNADQIQATIPLEVTIIATGDPTIQGEIVGPTNYRIENRSTTSAIKVRTVRATGNGKGWNLDTMTSSGTPNLEDYGILDIDLKPTTAPDTAAVALKDAFEPQSVRGEMWAIAKRPDASAEAPRLDLDLIGTSKIAQGVYTLLGDHVKLTENAFTITYTVGLHTPGDPLEGNGSGNTEKDKGFFLRIVDNPYTAALAPYAKRIFDLQDIQEHSRALPTADESSELLRFYKALCTSMRPEGDYECWVRYNNEDWPVRIIGVNQDVAAEYGNGYELGSLVGLTFQFRDLVGNSFNSDARAISINAGGWGGPNMRLIRESLNDVDGPGVFLEPMDDNVQRALVKVRKYYGPTATSDSADSIAFTEDKMFIASFFELSGQQPAETTGQKPWVIFEGAGADHDEQYLFYQNKNIDNTTLTNNASTRNRAWLAKRQLCDWSNSRADKTYLNTFTDADHNGESWWTRSVRSGAAGSFYTIRTSGSFYPNGNVEIGVCPCFCL